MQQKFNLAIFSSLPLKEGFYQYEVKSVEGVLTPDAIGVKSEKEFLAARASHQQVVRWRPIYSFLSTEPRPRTNYPKIAIFGEWQDL